MMILITYDISTSCSDGSKRLRKVAKKCQNYGIRVQNSVFECILDATQLGMLRKELLDIINSEEDSLRIYNLGNKYKCKIEHFGAKRSFLVEDPLIL